MAKGLSSAEQAAILARLKQEIAALDDAGGLTYDELSGFSTEEILAYLDLNGVQVNEAQLRDQIEATLGPDLKALERGEFLDAPRMELLQQRIAKVTETTARQVAKQVMRSQRQSAQDDADPRPDSERIFMWVARLRKSCRSCEERHGQLLAMDQWLDVGRPEDALGMCGLNCECSLLWVPDATPDDTKRRVESVRPASLLFPR